MTSGKWRGKPRRQYSREWHRVRALVRIRSGNRCEIMGCGVPARDVDHITPVHLGGLDVIDNAMMLCDSHHKEKTQREAQESRRNKKVSKFLVKETHPFDLL